MAVDEVVALVVAQIVELDEVAVQVALEVFERLEHLHFDGMSCVPVDLRTHGVALDRPCHANSRRHYRVDVLGLELGYLERIAEVVHRLDTVGVHVVILAYYRIEDLRKFVIALGIWCIQADRAVRILHCRLDTINERRTILGLFLQP